MAKQRGKMAYRQELLARADHSKSSRQKKHKHGHDKDKTTTAQEILKAENHSRPRCLTRAMSIGPGSAGRNCAYVYGA